MAKGKKGIGTAAKTKKSSLLENISGSNNPLRPGGRYKVTMKRGLKK